MARLLGFEFSIFHLLAETTTVFVPQCPAISLAERVDCFPDAGASKV